MAHTLLLLGDQLDHCHPIFERLDANNDTIIMAELDEEAQYVRHNKHKIAFIFSAMRHFARELEERGFRVHYYAYTSTEGQWSDFKALLAHHLAQFPCDTLHLIEANEHRLQQRFEHWQQRAETPIVIHPASHFLFSKESLIQWLEGRKAPRMEHFYQWARKETQVLMEDQHPVGGQFNYDKDNRQPWDEQQRPPEPKTFEPDDITAEVIDLVNDKFAEHPGDLSQFGMATTHKQAQAVLDDFIEHRLSHFGAFQDALPDDEPYVYHSLLSAYINAGLLSPWTVIKAAEQAYWNKQAPLNACEGFIRQILGWREYVRGIYWFQGTDYGQKNHFNATHPLPEWFWSGDTKMRCVSQAVTQSLELGYAHHIQRLMVIGNFALIAGLDVKAVCDWYLAVYVDAFEWVELPNTLGMALYGDGGLLASKPYAASGRYIHKMGTHCQQCPYKPTKQTGDDACPFNALYWQFIHRHKGEFEGHRRMGLMAHQWQKKNDQQQGELLDRADHILAHIEQL